MYAFDIYYGCRGCNNAAGITLHWYSRADVAEGGAFAFVKDIPELPWQMFGDYGQFAVPLIDPETLPDALVKGFEDVECRFDGETMKLSELLDVEHELWQLVADHISRVFNAWLTELQRHKKRKARPEPG
jgi:hypothetical protein